MKTALKAALITAAILAGVAAFVASVILWPEWVMGSIVVIGLLLIPGIIFVGVFECLEARK